MLILALTTKATKLSPLYQLPIYFLIDLINASISQPRLSPGYYLWGSVIFMMRSSVVLLHCHRLIIICLLPANCCILLHFNEFP